MSGQVITLTEFTPLGTVHITLDRVEEVNSLIIKNMNDIAAVVYFVPKCRFEKPAEGKL